MNNRFTAITVLVSLLLGCLGAAENIPDEKQTEPLWTAAKSYALDSHIVSASFFHWYSVDDGQRVGPWRPVEGRSNWTGEVDWWKSQIKQIMAAHIDVLYVIVIPRHEPMRINFFKALSQLRAEGYQVPKVAPFFDPVITWGEQGQKQVDLATEAGKEELVSHYIRFFEQYFAANSDPCADDFIAQIDGRVVLNTWHIKNNTVNFTLFTRQDMESRLASEFGQTHPAFKKGVYMITTAISESFPWADERLVQFEANAYYFQIANANGVTNVQIKPGYWDMNVRNPGFFVPRSGGRYYRSVWEAVNANPTLQRVYIESWNEYDEGTGIYAANPGKPYIHPGSGNRQTDTWSETNDPFEYIRTTAQGAARFNDVPELDSKILWHTFPATMQPGQKCRVKVIVRNTGDNLWTDKENYTFKQSEGVRLSRTKIQIDDTADEISIYGGIFRGQPVMFEFEIKAPKKPGIYPMQWSMENAAGTFGEPLKISLEVE